MPLSRRQMAWLPILGILLTVVIWSSNNIVGKIIMREASPVLVALLRFSLAGLVFYLPVFLLLHRGAQRFTLKEWQRLIVMGTMGTVGSLVLYLTGLRTTPATEAGIYQITQPLFVLVVAWLWLGERLRRLQIVGFLLAVTGAYLLVTNGGAVGIGSGDLGGALFILGSNLTWSGYTLLSKEILARRSPLLVLSAANLVAMIAIWPLAGLMGGWEELPRVLTWSPTAWIVMIYLVAFMSTSSQWLYMWCIRELGAGHTSTFMYLMPFTTAILAAVFLREIPTLLSIGAGLLTLLGVWMVSRPQRAKRQTAPLPSRQPVEVPSVSER